jgi:nucleotide-binding universal stress UspA family protein
MNPSPSGNLDHQEVGPLRRQNMTKEEKVFNRNILIAVDESENARRAVSYVGQFLGGLTGFKVTILHVIPEPEEDYFPTSAQKERWFIRYKKKVDTMLEDYRELLIQKGFNPKDVAVHSTVRYCTIVVGRQGLSRSEEFLFGSISSKIVTHARNCTVWVVE